MREMYTYKARICIKMVEFILFLYVFIHRVLGIDQNVNTLYKMNII